MRALSASAAVTLSISGPALRSARLATTARHQARRTSASTVCTALRRRSCAISTRSDCWRAA